MPQKCLLEVLIKMNQNFFFSTETAPISGIAVFNEKSFATFTVKGFIAIAGAEFGKVEFTLQI
jgi:hypothetical protein